MPPSSWSSSPLLFVVAFNKRSLASCFLGGWPGWPEVVGPGSRGSSSPSSTTRGPPVSALGSAEVRRTARKKRHAAVWSLQPDRDHRPPTTGKIRRASLGTRLFCFCFFCYHDIFTFAAMAVLRCLVFDSLILGTLV
ncbi:hypothetical protein BD289DRAFT_117756 [Coniella lustricola]|uniref:Secreted protein n=1 Tax=Coniella lustricola TaxID=2025994 RepID=A0A2T2ZWQ1_9PEZI|nr:hypothetical protein BD289DRAFT_117756 [Coniella lustricola]